MRCEPGACAFHGVAVGNAVNDGHQVILAWAHAKKPNLLPKRAVVLVFINFIAPFSIAKESFYELKACQPAPVA